MAVYSGSGKNDEKVLENDVSVFFSVWRYFVLQKECKVSNIRQKLLPVYAGQILTVLSFAIGDFAHFGRYYGQIWPLDVGAVGLFQMKKSAGCLGKLRFPSNHHTLYGFSPKPECPGRCVSWNLGHTHGIQPVGRSNGSASSVGECDVMAIDF